MAAVLSSRGNDLTADAAALEYQRFIVTVH